MLILCIGPDTFRAQAKARELEVAFREKYDPTGSSVEPISSGKDGIDEVMQKAGTVSLFSPRRFLRGTDLLTDCPKAKLALLATVLVREPENVIVVSVETAPPPETILKALGSEVKIIKYEFAEEHGAAFQSAVVLLAKRLHFTDQEAITKIAQAADGDSWLAWNELIKASVLGSTAIQRSLTEDTIYEYIDRYLRAGKDRYAFAEDEEVAGEMLTLLLSQARSALRVRDGATQGLHPFVIKKMRAHAGKNLEQEFAHALSALLAQRFGLGDGPELSTIL